MTTESESDLLTFEELGLRHVRVVAVSGASEKTVYRIAEELLAAGVQPRLLLRRESAVPPSLSN